MTLNEQWTLAIAVYGAVVATMVFGWDVFKWLYAGPKLKVTVTAGMVEVGIRAQTHRRIVCTAVNRGDLPTTITHFSGHTYRKAWHRFVPWIRPAEFFIKGSLANQPLPFVLNAGQQWMGVANQGEELLKQMTEEALYMGVVHSHSDRPMYVRVRPPAPAAEVEA